MKLEYGMHVTKDPGGKDNPKDMAEAWLSGNLDRYERLKQAHIARLKPIVVVTHGKPGPKPRFDRDRIKQLRANGLTFMTIARIVGCSPSQVCKLCRTK